jgi:hypothetical protein
VFRVALPCGGTFDICFPLGGGDIGAQYTCANR